MGPSVSFLLPLRIAQKLPIRNSWELISGKLPDTVTEFNFQEEIVYAPPPSPHFWP